MNKKRDITFSSGENQKATLAIFGIADYRLTVISSHGRYDFILKSVADVQKLLATLNLHR